MMTTDYTRAECCAMLRYWWGDVRHCASLIVAAKRRADRTAARLALLNALTNCLEWRDRARRTATKST